MATANNKTRIKSKAHVYVPQNKDEVANAIRMIGDAQRNMLRKQAEMNDAIASITATFQPDLENLNGQISLLQEVVQAYCEAHRDELTNDGKVKTANLITGEVQWRQRPPSVTVRGADSVIETLKRLGLSQFIRTK